MRSGATLRSQTPSTFPTKAVALALYRIAQEAVTNAIKNGKANKIDMSLMRSREKLALSHRR